MKSEYTTDPKRPHIGDLSREFTMVGPVDGNTDILTDNHAVRYCVWENQSDDGKKHDREDNPAMPWDGASDHRYRLADSIIAKRVAMMVRAFWQNTVRAEGVGASDVPEAGAQTKMVQWLLRTKLRRQLQSQVELSANWMDEIGWVGLHITWRREVSLMPYELTMEMIMNGAAQMPEQFGALPELIYDESREAEAMLALQAQFSQFAQEQAQEIRPDEVPQIEASELRAMVRELRSGGSTIVPLPRLTRNEPEIEALKPYSEIFVPRDARDVQQCTVFVREMLTESEVRLRARDEKWNKNFLDEVIKTKGQRSAWDNHGDYYIGGLDVNLDADQDEFIEIVTAYTRRFDKRGVMGVYFTIFSQLLAADHTTDRQQLYAVHDLLDYRHGRIPVVVGCREHIAKSFTRSRGIPQMVKFDQRVGKVAHDAVIDHDTISVLPPVLTYEDSNRIVFGPARKIKVTSQQRKPEFMDIPRVPGSVLELWTITRDAAKDQHGLITPTGDPDELVAIRGLFISNFLAMWQQAFTQVYLLCKQYFSPEKYEKITEVPANSDYSMIDAMDEQDVFMEFDPVSMNSEGMTAKIKAIYEIAQRDTSGEIDPSLLTRLALAKVDPSIAQAISTDRATATQRMTREVRDELNSMVMGHPFMPVEMDPSAGMKLQIAQGLIDQNEKLAQAIKQDPQVNEMVSQYLKNLEHSYNQTTVNKERGRKGI